MAKTRIEGSFVALITPFNRDGSIDYDGFRTLLEFQARHGTAAVLIMGSTGEVSMLRPEERRNIVSKTVKHKIGGMLQFYGCTGNSTETTIENVAYAAQEGADGAIVAVPSYICPSEQDAVRYFLDVADASPIAIGIYNNPPRVKTDLTAASIARLAEHPNIVVNKEATARVAQIAQLAAAKPDISLMCCDSPNLGLVVPLMALGGHGTANMTGNLIPEELATISTPWKDFDDAVACRETWLAMLPLFHFTYSAINPVPVKSLMAALGLPAGGLRRPLSALEGEALQKGIAEKYGFTLRAPRAAAE